MTSRRFAGAGCVLAVWVALAGPVRTEQVKPSDGRLTAALTEIDSTIAADFAKDGVGGMSVGVVSDSRLIWSKHYGYADVETKRVADNDTVYRIGSITKQFTALALLQLVEQGHMRLIDPLEKYVPEVKQVKNAYAATPPITLLQVSTMHAGLAREPGCQNHSVGPVSEWASIVLKCLPDTAYVNQPGTTFLYSNIGYALLGLAIERAGKQPFTSQVADRILKPLGMTRSGMDPTPEMRANLAHGYQSGYIGGPNSKAADRELDGRGYRVPNGALMSTINDMARFVAWELGAGPESLLKKATQQQNYDRVFDNYGVGFQLIPTRDADIRGHSGSTAGYHASALFDLASKLGVVVLRNCDNCSVDANPVATAALQKLVRATR
jgi:CubicO group peptidase (beta-lactamase class C family)